MAKGAEPKILFSKIFGILCLLCLDLPIVFNKTCIKIIAKLYEHMLKQRQFMMNLVFILYFRNIEFEFFF